MPDSFPNSASPDGSFSVFTRRIVFCSIFPLIFWLLAALIPLLPSFPESAYAAAPSPGPQPTTPFPSAQPVAGTLPASPSDAIWPDGTPFVASTPEVIGRMLAMAGVKSGDVVYDIGSGDGVIVIQAAKAYGVRGVGIEIDAELVERARGNALREKVGHLVEFRAQDAFDAEISPATVVTLYMLPDFTAKFRVVMERQLKPGTRVVAHDYPIPGWLPDRVESYREESGREHKVMLFVVR